MFLFFVYLWLVLSWNTDHVYRESYYKTKLSTSNSERSRKWNHLYLVEKCCNYHQCYWLKWLNMWSREPRIIYSIYTLLKTPCLRATCLLKGFILNVPHKSSNGFERWIVCWFLHSWMNKRNEAEANTNFQWESTISYCYFLL